MAIDVSVVTLGHESHVRSLLQKTCWFWESLKKNKQPVKIKSTWCLNHCKSSFIREDRCFWSLNQSYVPAMWCLGRLPAVDSPGLHIDHCHRAGSRLVGMTWWFFYTFFLNAGIQHDMASKPLASPQHNWKQDMNLHPALISWLEVSGFHFCTVYYLRDFTSKSESKR